MKIDADDRLAILDLYARYNQTIDSADYDKWVACFVPDGVLSVVASGRVVKGRRDLKLFARQYVERNEGLERHVTTNISMVGNGTGVIGRCYLTMYIGAKLAGGAPRMTTTGRYLDTLVKEAGEWFFLKREMTSDGEQLPKEQPNLAASDTVVSA
ncbi:nuclear transport factor 2 family protein [Paenarthrobacter aurescens]|uniref:nuclear transport factor 2 family protein n=1 Tax=Paenarthrobacter aurescens TaxID=43663 RepID=UPI0035EFE343